MIPCQREKFLIPDDVAYFNCAYTAPLLKAAEALGRDAVTLKTSPWRLTTDMFFRDLNANRALFAALVGAEAEQVAIIPSVSYGIALAARNLPVQAGQSILILEDQFPSNVYVWRRLARSRGAAVASVPRPKDGNWTPAVMAAITPRTAVAALPHCHWTDGTLIDLQTIGQKCRDCGTALVVDGTQSLGAMPFSVPQIQPDFLVTTAHKWLLGPYSYGFCYVAPRWHEGRPLEENWLNREGSENFANLVRYRDGYQNGAQRFDAGEASNFILAPIAGAALRQILDWGLDKIAVTLRVRTDAIAERARSMGFDVADRPFRAPHLVGLRHPDGFPADMPVRLAAGGVYASARGDSIRIAPHLYNTNEDVDRLFQVLEAAAG